MSFEGQLGGEVLYTARTDVSVERQGEKFVIHDPLKSSFTQVGVAEYIVFRCFDGQSSVQAIADRLKAERDVIVGPEQVARLRDRLHGKQLLLAPGEVVKKEDATATEHGRGLARLVMIDLGLAFKADVFLTRMYHRVKYVVFRPAFFVALFAVVALASSVWMESWDRIRQQAAALEVGSTVLLYYGCLSLSLFCHEVAHGVATKGFGGGVPKMGAFLYYFVLVFYTDVSASWMFPSKFRRLMVLLAGATANLALCALSTLVWRITMQGSLVNDIAFALMTINAVATAFTLWPLLRGDGYYILSTALDVPNLRQNARKYVGALLRRVFVDRKTELPKATDREALIYLAYAPIQTLFVVGFFGFVAVKTASWLLGSLHALGFLLILVVLFDRLLRPLLAVSPREAVRWVARMWKVELMFAAVIGVLCVVPYDLHVSAPFEVTSMSPVAVRARTNGIVKRYTVRTGDLVRAGDVVAELVDDEVVLRRQAVAAELDQARAKLAEVEAGFRYEEVAQARVRAVAMRQQASLAAMEHRRVRRMFKREFVSRKDLDTAQHAAEVEQAHAREASAELAMFRRGYRQEERAQQRAVVRRVEQELALVEQQLAWTKVRAQVDGRVVSAPPDLQDRIGKFIARGDSVIDIVQPEELTARIVIPEHAMSDVAVGMPVTLRFYKDPDVAYVARVDAIEPVVTGAGVGIVCTLAKFEAPFLLGAGGVAKVEAGSHSILTVLARRMHRRAWVEFWSWW